MEKREPPFVVQYNHAGSTWMLHIWAEDWPDAEARLKSIGFNGRIIGSNASSVSANTLTLPFAALWVRLLCWWRNTFR